MGTSTKSHQSVYPLNHPGNQEFPWAVPVDTEEYGRSRAAPDLSDVLAGHNNHTAVATVRERGTTRGSTKLSLFQIGRAQSPAHLLSPPL
jgi:hypothetical protein